MLSSRGMFLCCRSKWINFLWVSNILDFLTQHILWVNCFFSLFFFFSYCYCDRDYGGFDCSVDLRQKWHSFSPIATNAVAILPAFWALYQKVRSHIVPTKLMFINHSKQQTLLFSELPWSGMSRVDSLLVQWNFKCTISCLWSTYLLCSTIQCFTGNKK